MTSNSHHPDIKRLYRSRNDQVIGGVAAGMAEYFNMDAALMRLIFILLVLLPGIGVIAYIIAWIIIPENPDHKKPTKEIKEITMAEDTTTEKVEKAEVIEHSEKPAKDKDPEGQRTLGLILVGVGAFFLLREFYDLSELGRYWPLILVVIGLLIIFKRGNR